jgi:sensor histidine kinase regulating citrate/malate metabolism
MADPVVYMVFALCGIVFLTGLVFVLRRYHFRVIDKKILAFQNDLITKHCTEVENIYRQMRGWRHDYHNHIQTLKGYTSLKNYDEIDPYLNKLDADLTTVDTVVKTGNVMVDAILNSKISLAASKNIAVNAKAIVPKNLAVSEIDLCVIIGNLIDNAAEACLKLENESERSMRVYVGIFKGQLYISVSNKMDGDIKKTEKGYGYVSDKGANHGFGLMRIDRITQKYGGYVNRKSEQGVFASEIMLPLKI